MAVISAGPYASLHQTDNDANTPPLSFLQTRCRSCRPTNSVKALKAGGLLSKSVNIIYKGAQWPAKAKSEAQEERVKWIGRPAGSSGS